MTYAAGSIAHLLLERRAATIFLASHAATTYTGQIRFGYMLLMHTG